MITEDYCNFENAKLLKEKGFNSDYPKGDCMQLGCTQQMAMKWLREVHKLFIEIGVSIDLNNNYHYAYAILDKECCHLKRCSSFRTYEDAVEAALNYVLEDLI